MSTFQDLIQKRRTIYALGQNIKIPTKDITALIEKCVWEAPTAFNAQTSRIVVLYGKSYQNFWKMVTDALRPLVPADKFPTTEARIKSFTTGIGTILFFEDDDITRGLQAKMPMYHEKFPEWAEHNNAMLQYIIWATLAEQNIGASLQHYNPLVDETVHKTLGLPANWRLIAQMPFGSIEKPADKKDHLPLKDRMKVFE